jgi:biopolymer transport protein ExbD
MRVRQLHPHQPAAKINVTPLIDVVMVLIIFYLIVGKLAADRNAQVALPSSAVGSTAETKEPVVITVVADVGGGLDPKARVLIDGVDVPMSGLEGALRARVGSDPAATVVQVRADRRLNYGAVEPVVKACRAAGLTAVRLVTERVGGGR